MLRARGSVGTGGGTRGPASAMATATHTPPRHNRPAAAYTRGLRTGERSVTGDTATARVWVQILPAYSAGWGQADGGGGRMGTSSPKNVQTTSNTINPNEQRSKTHPNGAS